MKRYECSSAYGSPVMDQDDYGEWVSFEDAERLLVALQKIETATDLLSAQAIARRALFETKP